MRTSSLRVLAVVVAMAMGVASFLGLASPAQAAGSACSAVGVTVTPMQGVNKPFYVSTSSTPTLMSGSVGWALSGAPVTVPASADNLWLKLVSVSSPATLNWNSSQPLQFPVRGSTYGGSNGLAAGLPVGYAYLTASGTSATAQTMTVEAWNGDPRLSGSSLICNFTDSVSSIVDVIVANANKPDTVKINTTPVLGGAFSMTVTGSTGTLGGGAGDTNVFSLSPNMGQLWPAGSYQLTKVQTTFGSGTPTALNDFLRINFADTASRTYTTVYTFLVRNTVASTTTPVPRMNIASGNQVKMSSNATSTQSISASVNPVTAGYLTQTVASNTNWNTGVATYTMTLTNTATFELCADAVVVTPPTGWSYINGSATIDGSAWPDPSSTSGTLTFPALCVPGSGSTVVVFQANITAATDVGIAVSIGGETMSSQSSGSASLKVKVMSTGTALGGGAISEIYDGVTVEVAKGAGAYGYKPAVVTNAAGEADFGSVDPNAAYTVKLTAPCDTNPVETKSPLTVVTGAYTPTNTLAATVPCAPVLSYTAGTNTLSWTEPNDGGAHVIYYTHHYKAPASTKWAMFARNWPADSATPAARSIPLSIYGASATNQYKVTSAPCPTKGTNVWPTANWGPAPYSAAWESTPECLRSSGDATVGSAFQWRLAARNALSTAGVQTPNGTGWSPYSNTVN